MKQDAGHTPFVRSRRGKSATPSPAAAPRAVGAAPSPSFALPHLPAFLTSAPHPDLSALVLVLVRVLGAYFVTSQWDRDADEAYNYWEPMHYMLYGSGMQTWENNVRFKFRSYGYGGLYAVLGFLLGGFHGDDKITVYYRVRIMLALICAAAEAYLYTSVKQRFGGRVALFMLLGSLLSAGMLGVAPSFLPNTFTMVGFMVAWGFWLRGLHAAAAATATGALALGFPFAVLALPPLALHVLGCTLPPALLDLPCVRPLWAWGAPAPRAPSEGGKRAPPAAAAAAWDWRPFLSVLYAALSTLAITTAYAACVDRAYYGQWTSYQVNTLLYNLGLNRAGNGLGSNNFADASVAGKLWYAQSLFLSHGCTALLALGSPLVFAAAAAAGGLAPSPTFFWRATITAQFLLYFAIYSLKAHKEERFLYPIYPLVPLVAALALDAALDALAHLMAPRATSRSSSSSSSAKQQPTQATPLLRALTYSLTALFFTATAALALSRVAMQSLAFSGHTRVWTHLARSTAFSLKGSAPGAAPLHAFAHPIRALTAARGAAPSLTVCMGQEWHRFPSSFFLPERTSAGGEGALALRYIRFEPSGRHPCLPQPFNASAGGGSVPNPLFNSDNEGMEGMFVDPSACDFVVDFEGVEGQGSSNALQPWFSRSSSSSSSSSSAGCVGGWERVYSQRYLDRSVNPAWQARSLYVPWVTPSKQTWGSYVLLKKC